MLEKVLGSVLPYTKTLRLLYVENDMMMRDAYGPSLQLLFKTVYTAENALEGLEQLSAHKIDLVIANLDLPVMDGITMAREIKKGDPFLPIIIITDYIEKELFIESIEVGIDAYLTRPIDDEQLFRVIHRIANQTHATKALKENSQYFDILTANSIVAKIDLRHNISYVNDNFCDTFGYERLELIGSPCMRTCQTDETEGSVDMMWEQLDQGNIWSSRMMNQKKDGTLFYTDTLVIPLKDDDDTIREFISIRQDVTQIVEMQATIDREVRKKQEQELINKAKESFLVLFTHELRTPLNAILNFSRYLYKKTISDEEIAPAKLAMLLRSITDNANSMLLNVNDILDISKLQANKLTFKKESFDPHILILSTLDELDSLIDAKGITVTTQPCDTTIYSDRQRVKQVFVNILSNAIKYGKDKIDIKTIEVDDGVEVIIADNGKGIEDKESVFGLYEQNDISALGREKTGTGVGLFFVKSMCENLGITYTLEDSPWGGAQFRFRFQKDDR